MDILTVLLITFVSPFVIFAANWMTERWRKRLAYKRLLNEPTIYTGAILSRLLDANSGVLLMGRCTVVSLSVGRMEIHSLTDNELMTFTGREFERLHPVVEVGQSRGGMT